MTYTFHCFCFFQIDSLMDVSGGGGDFFLCCVCFFQELEPQVCLVH